MSKRVVRPRRTDTNQTEIAAALRKIGCSVTPTHMVGHGFPDLACGIRGHSVLLEIKDGTLPPSRRKLTADELAWHSGWRGNAAVVYSVQDALDVVACLGSGMVWHNRKIT